MGEVELDFLSWGFKERPSVVQPVSRPVRTGVTLSSGERRPRLLPPSALVVSTTSAVCSATQSADTEVSAADRGVHAVLMCLSARCPASSSVHPKMEESQMLHGSVSMDTIASHMLTLQSLSPCSSAAGVTAFGYPLAVGKLPG